MMSERERRSDFKKKVSPYLEVLLQFSLCLAKNGRDATRLLRQSMAESYRSWDESIPEAICKIQLHKILTRRFYSRFRQHSRPLSMIYGDYVDRSFVTNNRLSPVTTANAGPNSPVTRESNEDVAYLKAIAGLHAMIRPAMILSYLEGFSNKRIANLAGAEPQTVESLLKRGRLLMREELFAHLMDKDHIDVSANWEKASE